MIRSCAQDSSGCRSRRRRAGSRIPVVPGRRRRPEGRYRIRGEQKVRSPATSGATPTGLAPRIEPAKLEQPTDESRFSVLDGAVEDLVVEVEVDDGSARRRRSPDVVPGYPRDRPGRRRLQLDLPLAPRPVVAAVAMLLPLNCEAYGHRQQRESGVARAVGFDLGLGQCRDSLSGFVQASARPGTGRIGRSSASGIRCPASNAPAARIGSGIVGGREPSQYPNRRRLTGDRIVAQAVSKRIAARRASAGPSAGRQARQMGRDGVPERLVDVELQEPARRRVAQRGRGTDGRMFEAHGQRGQIAQESVGGPRLRA